MAAPFLALVLVALGAFLAGAFLAGAFLAIFLVFFSAFLTTFLGLAALTTLGLEAFTALGLTAFGLLAFTGLAGEATGAGEAATGAGAGAGATGAAGAGVALVAGLALVGLAGLDLGVCLDYVISECYSRPLCGFGHFNDYRWQMLFSSFIIRKNTKCNLIGYIWRRADGWALRGCAWGEWASRELPRRAGGHSNACADTGKVLRVGRWCGHIAHHAHHFRAHQKLSPRSTLPPASLASLPSSISKYYNRH